jgi:uncharacterized protein with HEPN domain
MPTKSDIIRLRHMLEAADKAKGFTDGKARQDLDRDEKLALALVRLIEIIGEAAAKVSVDVQGRHANIPWKEIVGTRNRLIHGYEDVDYDIVWSIVVEDLPNLSRELRTVLLKETGTDQ